MVSGPFILLKIIQNPKNALVGLPILIFTTFEMETETFKKY